MARLADEAFRKTLLPLIPMWLHPNYLTVLRGLCIIPLLLVSKKPVEAIAIISFSSALDISDGIIARLRGLMSRLGAYLDPLSDKVFVLGALFFACAEQTPLWLRITIGSLDAFLTILRPIKQWFGVTTKSNGWGSAKTWTQTIGIGFILSQKPSFIEFGLLTLNVAIGVAVMSVVWHVLDFKQRKQTPTGGNTNEAT